MAKPMLHTSLGRPLLLTSLGATWQVTSGATLTPRCYKSPLHLGFVRMAIYVAAPFALALLTAIAIHTWYAHCRLFPHRPWAHGIRAEAK